MRNVVRIISAVGAAIFAALPVGAQTETAQIDKPIKTLAPLCNMVTGERNYRPTLADYTRGNKAVLLVFVANRCGVTWQYADKIAALQKRYVAPGKVAIIGVHSNFEETDAELMTELKKRKLNFPVLDDKPAQEMATYFGATVTPYFVVIDGKGVLRYKGAFDKMGGSVAESKRPQYLRPALDAILTGKPVAKKTVRALGCEIARREKTP
ncbi:MAG: redoxin domain-containing protein [Armatimonadetes bacterium]|nr:redoxin domain-containing protein [Armatimonadota bacterium]